MNEPGIPPIKEALQNNGLENIEGGEKMLETAPSFGALRTDVETRLNWLQAADRPSDPAEAMQHEEQVRALEQLQDHLNQLDQSFDGRSRYSGRADQYDKDVDDRIGSLLDRQKQLDTFETQTRDIDRITDLIAHIEGMEVFQLPDVDSGDAVLKKEEVVQALESVHELLQSGEVERFEDVLQLAPNNEAMRNIILATIKADPELFNKLQEKQLSAENTEGESDVNELGLQGLLEQIAAGARLGDVISKLEERFPYGLIDQEGKLVPLPEIKLEITLVAADARQAKERGFPPPELSPEKFPVLSKFKSLIEKLWSIVSRYFGGGSTREGTGASGGDSSQ